MLLLSTRQTYNDPIRSDSTEMKSPIVTNWQILATYNDPAVFNRIGSDWSRRSGRCRQRWALNVVSVLQRVLWTRNAFRPDWHHVVQEIHSQRQVISSISVCVLLRLVECQSCTVHLRTIDSTVQPLLYSVEQEAQLSQKGRAPTVSLKILLSYSSEITPLSKLCKLFLVFSCNYVSVLYHFRDIWCWNWNPG